MNYPAILVSGIVNMLLGYLYYLPAAFGTRWAAFVGMDSNQMGRPPWFEVVIGVGLAFIQAFAIAWVLKHTDTTSFAGAMKLMVIVWLGFVVVSSLSWFNWQNNSAMFFINNLYYLISFAAMFTILVLWK